MQNRRVCLYFSWSRPREINIDLGVLDNRYPTLFEFRRAIWPMYEWASDPARYRQDVSGFLDHVVLFDFRAFHDVIVEETGHPISIIQREGDKPPVMELDDELLSEVDTLIVISLDHFRSEQRASRGEVEAIRAFLGRESSCLIVCPHHDVGAVEELSAREVQHRHHGDQLVPSQQRIGGFAKSLLDALGFPIENRFGLSPGRAADGSPAMLVHIEGEHGRPRILENVRTFNLHPHLPHFWIPPSHQGAVSVLAKQSININATPHPFTQDGTRHLDAFLHIPPGGDRSGHIFVCDATLWSAAFSGKPSLQQLWRNVAQF
jgi:hypothetical protein